MANYSGKKKTKKKSKPMQTAAAPNGMPKKPRKTKKPNKGVIFS